MREQILEAQNILLGAPSESREDAIRRVGQRPSVSARAASRAGLRRS